MDKTLTNAYYEFDIDEKTLLPRRIRMTVLAGRRGATEKEGRKIVGGEHVAFHFTYLLKDYGKVKRLEIPREAARLLAIANR
jgi:hypothetical protein